VSGVPEETAGAGVHGRHEDEAGGEGARRQGPRDGDLALFERLAQHLETPPVEFGQFIEEENAMMRERDLAWARRTTTADHAGVADGVVCERNGRVAIRASPGGRRPVAL